MESDEGASLWKDWKSSLVRGKSPAADAAQFVSAMCSYSTAQEAIDIVTRFPKARPALQQTLGPMRDALSKHFDNSNLQPVLAVVFDPQWFEEWLVENRGDFTTSMVQRANLVNRLASFLCNHCGRQWVRERAVRWWRDGEFSEEEGDELVRCFLSHEVFRVPDFEHWGSRATETANRVARRLALDGNLLWLVDDVRTTPQIGGPSTPSWLRDRTGMLSQCLSVPVDLKDSGFQKSELDRLQKRGWPNVGDWRLLERAFERRMGLPFRHLFHEFPELAAAFVRFPQTDSNPSPTNPTIQLPLLRLMHMRLLLESPSLSDALDAPEVFLVPDVAQYVMGRDYVSYTPELRVFGNSERRWRARWVETTAEAMASLVLEDALRFDLTTLSRIPETKDPTPDFMGVTETDEKIVFETKGATAWKTHTAQRKEALAQLGKSVSSKSNRNPPPSWAGYGRAFAVCLFAAKQADEKTSFLHINDPVFAFRELFDEGWEDRSRRQHFAGVLEAAQLFDVAEQLLHQRPLSQQRERQREMETFQLDDGHRTDERNIIEGRDGFIGTYLPIQEWARRLRHPDREVINKLRMFVGLNSRYFDLLAKGTLPARCRVDAPSKNSDRNTTPRISSRTGLLPSRGFPGYIRGVYSLLSNGSLLAIEVDL